jgi:hypothetical protein
MRLALLAIAALVLLAAIPMATASPDTTCLPENGSYRLPTGVQARSGTEWIFSGAPNGMGSYDGVWTPLVCTQMAPPPSPHGLPGLPSL